MDINVKDYDTIVGKFEFEPEGRFFVKAADVNFCNITGLSKDNNIDFLDMISEDSIPFFSDAVDNAKKGELMGVCVTLDTTSEHNIVTYIAGIYDEKAKVVKASLIDITMMSAGLDFNSTIYSRTEYEFILNNIECPVIMFDFMSQPKIIFANRSLYSMIGYTSEEVTQVYNRDAKAFLMFDGKRYDTEEDMNMHNDKFSIDISIKTKLDGVIPVTLKGQKIILNDGRTVALCIINTNKDRIELENMVNFYKNRFDLALSMSENIFFELNLLTNKLVFFNYDYRGIAKGTPLEYNEEDILGRNLIHPDDLKKIYSLRKDARENSAKTLKVRVMNTKGFYENYDMTFMPIFNQEKELISVFVKAINIRVKGQVFKSAERIKDSSGLVKFDDCREFINSYIEAGKDISATINSMILLNIDNYETLKNAYSKDELAMLKTAIVKSIEMKTRREDIISHIGESMYMIFIAGSFGYDLINKIPYDIEESLAHCNVPCEAIPLKVSMGISIYPDNGLTYDTMFEKALITLNVQRRTKVSGIKFYDDHFNQKLANDEYKEDVNYEAIEHYVRTRFAKISEAMLTENENTTMAIYSILATLGDYFALDRIKIINIIKAREQVMYFWSKRGVEDNSKRELEYMMKYKELISNDEHTYALNDVSELENNDTVSKVIKELNIKAIMQKAIIINSRTVGFLIFEKATAPHVWSFSEKVAIDVMSNILGMKIYENYTATDIQRELPGYLYNDDGIPVYMVDKNIMKIENCNKAFRDEFGENMVGQKCYKAIFGYDSPCKNCVLYSDTINGIKTREIYDNKKDAWFSQRAILYTNTSEKYYVSTKNITAFVERINSKDALTKLDSINVFKSKIKERIASMSNYCYGLASIDFDKFKDINQTIGYEKGDELIIDYSEYISETLKPNEMVCHVSADKFLLFFEYSKDESPVQVVSSKNNVAVSKLRKKYKNVQLSTTAGIYLIKPSDFEINGLIDKTNIASKTVKTARQSTYAIYDDEMERKALKEKEIENKMYRALENHEFVIYYQPKTDLKTEKIAGAEALVRWQDTPGHLVPPMDFIPLFEKNGFITELDYYIFEEVFKFITKTIKEGKKVVPISLNVSRAHIYEDDFVERLVKLKDKYNIDASLVELELTEGSFLSDQYIILRLMNELREVGFKLSIDDFGSGFSSLNMLKDLPIDILKLDKEFFPKGDMDERVKTIFINVVKMAKELNIIPLTEGVETKEQAEFLKEVGCVLAQGYYYSRPLPEADFEKYVAEHDVLDI